MALNPRGIVTPEAVVLEFETAGIGSRGLARVIDLLIQAAALFAVLIFSAVIDGTVALVLAIVGVALVVIGYPILCETLMRGRSPGKAALGLRVITVEGAPVTAHHAFIRSTVGLIDFLVPVPGGGVAVVTALLSPMGQRLGDIVAGTIVLRERTAHAPAMAVWFNPPAGLEGYAQTLDVTSVTDAQFAVVRAFLVRVHELAPEARYAMTIRMATPLTAAMRHTPPAGVHPELFLVCVAAAYQRRRGAPTSAPWAPPPPPPPPVGAPPPPPPLDPPRAPAPSAPSPGPHVPPS
jgi:uncharacterized RDD family membrane protein YckC